MESIKIKKNQEDLFKIRTYSEKGMLTSIKYGDNYISELLCLKDDKSNNSRLAITIKR